MYMYVCMYMYIESYTYMCVCAIQRNRMRFEPPE